MSFFNLSWSSVLLRLGLGSGGGDATLVDLLVWVVEGSGAQIADSMSKTAGESEVVDALDAVVVLDRLVVAEVVGVANAAEESTELTKASNFFPSLYLPNLSRILTS